MAVKHLENATKLLNFPEGSYFERTSRPIYSLVFLLPFIIFYELAVIFMSSSLLQESNVLVDTFVWLQKLMQFIRIDPKFTWLLPPLVVVIFLLALQITCKRSWKFRLMDIIPMNIECVLLAVPLIFLGLLINSSGIAGNPEGMSNQVVFPENSHNSAVRCTVRSNSIESSGSAESGFPGAENEKINRLFTNIVTGIGAGIYEELVFRLILISGFMILFQDLLRFGKLESVILSVLLSAFLFSLHHNIDFITGQVNSSEPFHLPKFIFRTLAGIYFAVIFAVRRFGVTAGTHAFYNIIAVITNAAFFGG